MFSFECLRRKDEEDSLEVLGCVDPAKARTCATAQAEPLFTTIGYPRIE